VGVVPWHQVGPFEGMAEFVEAFVCGSSGFTDVHQEIFANGFYPVEAGFPGDLPEFFFGGSEGDPRGPWEGGPVMRKEVQEYQFLVEDFFFRVAVSAGKFRTCILRWQFGQRATVFSMRSFPSFESHSM